MGKTTSAINIGASLAELGRQVLLIDFDPQANLSSGVGVATDGHGIYEVISESLDITRAIRPTATKGLSVVPSNINLSGATVELIAKARREHRLADCIQSVTTTYDYILIDSPPSLGILTINGLVASHKVLVPLQCEYFALEGLTQLLTSIQRVQSTLNRGLQILGILCTMFDARTRLSQEVVKEVIDHFGRRVLTTVIPRLVRISEAPSYGQPITLYDKNSQGAASYIAATKEIIKRVEH